MALSSLVATFFEGRWYDGNFPIIRAADHAAWLGTMVFDGARQFEGVMPDLDLHCQRLINSATTMGMEPNTDAKELQDLVHEGVKRLPAAAELYIRPTMWAREGSPGVIDPDPTSAAFAVCLEGHAMPSVGSLTLTVAPFRRPGPDMALSTAKASSLYVNNGRIMAYARSKGFSNALSLDPDGNVAETASTNVFMVRDGDVLTPKPNVYFLNGITRQRVIKLLKADGIDVTETDLKVEDFQNADEIFVTGNLSKVMPAVRFEDRELGPGKIGMRARELYWDFALSSSG